VKHLLLLEVKACPKRVVSLRKVCEDRLCLQKKRNKLVDRGKWLKETRVGVGLVSNSTFLNRDVGIMGLAILNLCKQIIVSPSCLPSALLSSSIVLLLYILCVLYCLVDIVYIYL
jgi:hypothetical protein